MPIIQNITKIVVYQKKHQILKFIFDKFQSFELENDQNLQKKCDISVTF